MTGSKTTPALLLAALLYTSIGAGANPALAEPALDALRAGDMRRMVLHDAPRPALATPYTTAAGEVRALSADAGRVLLINFWATWCAPCREEMPTLNALQQGLGGADFAVLTIATGRNNPAKMQSFFAEYGITALPLHADPGGAMAREAGVLGLPATLLLDRQGREVGRMLGGADWNGPEARAMIVRLIEITR